MKTGIPTTPTSAEVRVSASLQAVAGGIEDTLKEIAGERFGFVLLAFPFDKEKSNASYVSNADRDEMIRMMRALLERWDAGLATPAVHELEKLSG